MVNHIALVFGVVEAERAAQVFREVFRCIVVVTGLHMRSEGIPEIDPDEQKQGSFKYSGYFSIAFTSSGLQLYLGNCISSLLTCSR